MKSMQVASLLPGRVQGQAETDPARSAGNKILFLRQEQLSDVSVPPGGLVLIAAQPLSHPVIHWLSRDVPMALIDAEPASKWRAGESVLLDSACGEIRASEGHAETEPWCPPIAPKPGEPIQTTDGAEIWFSASVGSEEAIRRAVAAGAAAIGLVRSEYLIPDQARRPAKEFYQHVFFELLKAAGPLPLTIRLLDLAGDKWPIWLPGEQLGGGYCRLHGSQLFSYVPVREAVDAQLAALQDLGSTRALRLLWPSGGRLDDFMCWQDSTKRLFASAPPIGAMIETPIEMLTLGRWLTDADFVSIGCNDLLANLCGASRDDPRLYPVLDPYRPELFRFLGDCSQRAEADLKRLELCGLLPQIEGVLPVLIGLGYRRFSGEPALIPLLARIAANLSLRACSTVAEAVCSAGESGKVRELLGVPSGRRWGLVHDGASADTRGEASHAKG